MQIKILQIILFLSLLLIYSCKDEPVTPSTKTGKININFEHHYNGEILEFDKFRYVNTAGNQLQFSEIQYFISDVVLHYHDGSEYLIDAWKDIHYIDSDIPSTLNWSVYDSIPAGVCDSVSFTFGINEAENQSFLFVNPPESLMFWPDILGGGYHYLKLNGKWISDQQQVSPYNFHLGIGQIYDNEGYITGFVQNYFRVTMHDQPFEIKADQATSLSIIMNVESWFDTPNIWDFNYWGGDIMQNQAAMHTACENGPDAFSLAFIATGQ